MTLWRFFFDIICHNYWYRTERYRNTIWWNYFILVLLLYCTVQNLYNLCMLIIRRNDFSKWYCSDGSKPANDWNSGILYITVQNRIVFFLKSGWFRSVSIIVDRAEGYDTMIDYDFLLTTVLVVLFIFSNEAQRHEREFFDNNSYQ